MLTFSVRPIRLLLQILTADAFIGERDKTTCGKAIDLKPQGNCGRLQIVTSTGSCVWRLSSSVASAVLSLWSEISLVGLSSHSDTKLDYLAEQIVRCPQGGNVQLAGESSDIFPQFIAWHLA